MQLPFARPRQEDRPVLIVPVSVRHPRVAKQVPSEHIEGCALEGQFAARWRHPPIQDVPYILKGVTWAPPLVTRYVTRHAARLHEHSAVMQVMRLRAQVCRDRALATLVHGHLHTRARYAETLREV